MGDFVTDTHALIWYLEDSERLGAKASTVFDACDQGDCVIYIPTICLVEIVYLTEKGKIPAHLKQILDDALTEDRVGLVPMPLTNEIVNTLPRIPRSVVPDMPDRIIAATAFYLGLPLLTRDSQIQRSGLHIIW